MLKDSQFSRDVGKAEKLISSADKILTELRKSIDDGDKEKALEIAMKYELLSEKIVNNARLIPIATGVPFIEEEINENIINSNDVVIKYLNNNDWFYVKIPSLLPKKEKGNPSYIRATLQVAMKKFFKENPKHRLENDSVIIFKHNYSKSRPEREYRDHDNIELNSIVDLISLYTLVDDTPFRLRHYYCSYVEDEDSTEVYVVPNKDFINWLEKQQERN